MSPVCWHNLEWLVELCAGETTTQATEPFGEVFIPPSQDLSVNVLGNCERCGCKRENDEQ